MKGGGSFRMAEGIDPIFTNFSYILSTLLITSLARECKGRIDVIMRGKP